jgi:capsid protein
LESWKTLDRRKVEFGQHFCSPIRAAWQEEVHEEFYDCIADVMPSGDVPDFPSCRDAYSRVRWMGPGRGWVDPVAEKQGAVLGMQAGLSTLEEECAQQGLDYEEVIEQRAYEIKLFEKHNIPQPEWTGEHREQALQSPGRKEENTGKLPAKPKRTSKTKGYGDPAVLGHRSAR